MVTPEVVAQVIRNQRKSKRLSQEVVSGLAGVDRTHYSKIERGLRMPNIDTLFKIAAALNIPPHQLVMEIERAIAEEPDRH